MKTKPTTVLLAIIALLLAISLVVSLPEATAQTHLKAPQLVDVAVVNGLGHLVLVRIWSDGFAEYKVTLAGIPGWEPQVWTPLPVNPNAPLSRPIAVTETTGSVGVPHIYRLWADGTVDGIRFGQAEAIVITAVEGWITEPN